MSGIHAKCSPKLSGCARAIPTRDEDRSQICMCVAVVRIDLEHTVELRCRFRELSLPRKQSCEINAGPDVTRVHRNGLFVLCDSLDTASLLVEDISEIKMGN